MNLLELRNGIVHADDPGGLDYTLCGCDAEITVKSRAEYHPEDETETEPHMMPTRLKVTCPRCAAIIRYCVSLGTQAIGKKGCAE